MSNSFYYIFKSIQKYPKWALLLAVLFLVGSVFLIKDIRFNEDINKVIPSEQSTASASDIAQHMSFTDKVAVIFTKKDSGSTEDLSNAAQAFIDTLENFQPYYHTIQGTLDEELFDRSFQFVYSHLPIYLDEQDYQIIEQKLDKDSIKHQISANYNTLMSGSGSFLKDMIIQDPLQISFLALRKLQQFQGGSDYVFSDGFLYAKDGKRLFLFINPKYGGAETKHNEDFVDHLRNIQAQLNSDYPTVETSYFGSAFIAVANAKQIKRDILTTVAISVTLLMAMLIFYYRNWLVPIIVMIPSVFGGLFGILCLYFIKSEISAISLSISAILIGITIDYALHFLTHSKGSRDQKQLFRDVSKPLLMSSTTTAVAFLCLLFVRSEALVDLGIFASIAVVATAIFTLIILPHVYAGKPVQHVHTIDKIASYPFEKNKFLIGTTLLLIVISLFTYHRVTFDGDLSKINYIPKDQQEGERILSQGNEVLKTLFIVSYGADEKEVLEKNALAAKILDTAQQVINYQSFNSLVPSQAQQQQAIARWNTFWTAQRKAIATEEVEQASLAAGFVENTHQAFYAALNRSYTGINLDSLKAFDEQFFREFVHGKPQQLIISNTVTVRPADRDAFVHNFNQSVGKEPLMLIDRQALNEQYLGFLIKDFNDLVSYSFLAVLIILFIFYKRIELVIVAAIPIALTGFITAGLMGLLQVPFNIFSTIVCTLIFGHGIDFTIFMTSALLKQYTDGKDEMPIYRTSIILAVLTTILAIGALIFAQHPALKSISAIALIGVSVAVLVTFVLYPILFKLLFFNRVKKGLSPINLGLLLQGMYLFGYFALASIVVSFLIRTLCYLLPISRTKKELLFSKWMSWYMTSVLFIKVGMSIKIFGKEKLKSQTQHILIANHTSFLDTLSMAMLHERIIYMVNDWVFKSPVFGRAVRFLGFLPTSAGLDAQLDKLKARIGKLFSIVVFPEGTRSKTAEIHRFHKGAFYLSEELDVPITPVYLHGNAESLPKGDFIIYDGLSEIHVGDPILPSDPRFGTGYAQRTKGISKHFKETFKQIRLEREGQDYFRKKLKLNYLYKENNLAKKVMADFSLHKSHYHRLFMDIEEDAKIAHITGDYGQVDFLMVHQFASRKITTYNPKDHNRAISRASFILQKFNIRYVDHLAELWNGQDTLVLSHLENLTVAIPAHIQKIICLCSNLPKEFVDFKISFQTDNYTIYERNEGN